MNLRLLATTVLVASCAFAFGQNNLTQEIFDSASDYSALFMHDSMTTVHSHAVDHLDEWKIWGGFFCFGETLIDDKLAYGLAVGHVVAPHGESPSDYFTFANLIVPNDFPEDPRYIRLIGEQFVIPHSTHYDIHNSQGICRLAYFLGKADIGAYNLLVVGEHTTNPNACIEIGTESIKENVNGITDDDSIGMTSMCIDPATGGFSLTMGINGQPLANLARVSMHLGGTGQNGQVIYDLGGPNDWTDLDGQNVSRHITGQFPQQFVGALMNGQVYVQVYNQQYPNGSIRGQMQRVPYGVVPSSARALRGRVLSGGTLETGWPEDEWMVVQRFFTLSQVEEPVQIELTGWTWQRQPLTLTIQVEAHASSPNIRQTLQAYNYQADAYEVVDQRVLGTSDSRAIVTLNQSPGRYVANDGTVKTLVTYSAVGPTPNFLWSVGLDQLHWSLAQ